MIRYLPETLAQSRLHPETKTLNARSDIFHEIFDVCLRHGGYVSRNYVTGYWAHVASEGSGVGARLLRSSRTLRRAVAEAHYLLLNRRRFARRLRRGVVR